MKTISKVPSQLRYDPGGPSQAGIREAVNSMSLGGAPLVKDSDITCALKECEEQISKLQTRVGLLGQRLIPVLKDAPNAPQDRAPEERYLTPMAQHLAQISYSIRDLSVEIDGLMERLGL